MDKKLKYEQYTKEELIEELEALKKKKYGLVWDRKNSQEMLDSFVNWENMPENFIPRTFPVLEEVKDKEIATDKNKPINLLIEGDNYHSLAVLNFTHKNAVDVIYIDPPYNTGNNDFIYNDKFVAKEDPWRHSKWLSFMEKRLNLAKSLLKKTGIIFISIDDNEQSQLKLLCDEIFDEKNFVANLIWSNKEGGGSSDSKNFRVKHEYVLVYAKSIDHLGIEGVGISNEERYTQQDKHLKRRGKYYLQKLNQASIQYSTSLDYPIKSPDNTNIYPKQGDKRACWRWSGDKVAWGIKNDFIVFKKDRSGSWQVYSKQYMYVDNEDLPIVRSNRPFGVIDEFSSIQATKLLENIFHKKVFDYPKPYQLIKYLIARHPNKNAVVLDFMAGTGTTGHAVLELNEDGGNRSFILCTNNENNICSDVCYPRLEKLMNGYIGLNNDTVAGFGGNLKYFRNNFVGAQPTDKNKRELVNKSTEMICIRESIFDPLVKNGLNFKIFHKEKNYLGIIFDEEAVKAFIMEANKLGGKFAIYCFSYGEFPPEKEFSEGMKNQYTIKPIPEIILKIYREIFKK